MTNRRGRVLRLAAMALLAGLLLLLGGCKSLPLHRQRWVVVETQHFRVMSTLGSERADQLATDLELFRSGVEFAVGRKIPPPAVKPRVMAFDERGLVRPFMLYGDKGYFLPTLAGPRLVLRAAGDWEEDSTQSQRSAYARYLIRESLGRAPLWFESGVGHFASTMERRGRGVLVGRPRDDYMEALKQRKAVSLAETLNMTSLVDAAETRRLVFESRAWALVHYSKIGSRKRRGLVPLDRFVSELAGGASPRGAVRAAFGADAEELADAVSEYVERDEIAGVFVSHEPGRVIPRKRTELSHAEGLGELAQLALDLARPDVALTFYEYAQVLEPGGPRWIAGTARAEAQQGSWDLASEHAAEALRRAPENAEIQRTAAHVAFARAQASEAGSEQATWLEHAASHLRRSRELDAANPETHALLADVLAASGVDLKEGFESLAAARRLLPASLELDVVAAALLRASGDADAARLRLTDAISRTESESTDARARAALSELGSR